MMRIDDVPVRLCHMWKWQGEVVVVVSDAHFNLVRFVFNSVGSKIWALMNGERSVKEITQALAAKHSQVPFEEICHSTVQFLEELQGEWLAVSREELATYD